MSSPPAEKDVGPSVSFRELEPLLARHFEEARAAWVGVDLPAEEYVWHVAERLPADGKDRPVKEVLDAMALSDLYLACACANGVPGAVEALERELLAKLPPMLERQFRKEPADKIEDAVQKLRAKLLLAESKGNPHILTYTGQGGLLSWMRVIAARMVSHEIDPNPPEPASIFPEPSAPGGGQEEHVLKEDLRRKFRLAVKDAIASVTSKDQRYLLQLHYFKGVSTVKLAKLYGTNQPGMWRRLERIRESIFVEAKRLLRERHDFGEDDLKELFHVLQSRLDLTLSQIFESGDRG